MSGKVVHTSSVERGWSKHEHRDKFMGSGGRVKTKSVDTIFNAQILKLYIKIEIGLLYDLSNDVRQNKKTAKNSMDMQW
jgi:hypothetical protein